MRNHFWLIFFLMVVFQTIICTYFQFTQYVMLSILPVLILLFPIRYSTPITLFVAFASALFVDFLGEGGMLGLNVVALLPVAFLKNGIVKLVFGGEVFARGQDVTFERYGAGKMSTAIIIAQAVFLILYIWIDSAGTRPFWFNLARFAGSLAAGYCLSLALAAVLTREDRDGWK